MMKCYTGIVGGQERMIFVGSGRNILPKAAITRRKTMMRYAGAWLRYAFASRQSDNAFITRRYLIKNSLYTRRQERRESCVLELWPEGRPLGRRFYIMTPEEIDALLAEGAWVVRLPEATWRYRLTSAPRNWLGQGALGNS